MKLPEYLASLAALPECHYVEDEQGPSCSTVVGHGIVCAPCRSRLAAFGVLLGMVKAASHFECYGISKLYRDSCDPCGCHQERLRVMTEHIPPDAAERGRG